VKIFLSNAPVRVHPKRTNKIVPGEPSLIQIYPASCTWYTIPTWLLEQSAPNVSATRNDKPIHSVATEKCQTIIPKRNVTENIHFTIKWLHFDKHIHLRRYKKSSQLSGKTLLKNEIWCSYCGKYVGDVTSCNLENLLHPSSRQKGKQYFVFIIYNS
jgi:hypothetical protein